MSTPPQSPRGPAGARTPDRLDPQQQKLSQQRQRSSSRSRSALSRPTTPLRPVSRSSFRDSACDNDCGPDAAFPLNALEPAFAELADSVADLEANMMHFQLIHESLARFSESFASFLYGLNMNAFCVDFPEGPIPESFKRANEREEQKAASISSIPTATTSRTHPEIEGETTFLTTDTSFIENPQAASSSARGTTSRPRSRLPPPQSRQSRQSRVPAPSTRGGRGGTGPSHAGRTTGRGTRGRAEPRSQSIR